MRFRIVPKGAGLKEDHWPEVRSDSVLDHEKPVSVRVGRGRSLEEAREKSRADPEPARKSWSATILPGFRYNEKKGEWINIKERHGGGSTLSHLAMEALGQDENEGGPG